MDLDLGEHVVRIRCRMCNRPLVRKPEFDRDGMQALACQFPHGTPVLLDVPADFDRRERR